MRWMNTRQATKQTAILLTQFAFITACSAATPLIPTSTPPPPAFMQMAAPTFAMPTDTPTVTPQACLSRPGTVDKEILESTNPPQEFFIYLPPCYDDKPDRHYPVLYLLHGQTYTADQWIRLGAVDLMDNLILSGETMPFIIVFPDDRYWNQPSGTGFGQRLTNDLIPYIDLTYRTLPSRNHRAIGGMSRGAGWALQLGLSRPDLFSIIGLHSVAVFQKDASKIPNWLTDFSPASRPRIFMDIGDNDQELVSALAIESQFNQYGIAHEWHLYSGDHTEKYWSAHIEEYIQWYSEQWNNQ